MIEHFIDGLERIILDCWCGEKLILLGEEHDWRSRNAIFRCYCGQNLTLDNRIDEEALKIKELVRNLTATYNWSKDPNNPRPAFCD